MDPNPYEAPRMQQQVEVTPSPPPLVSRVPLIFRSALVGAAIGFGIALPHFAYSYDPRVLSIGFSIGGFAGLFVAVLSMLKKP